MVSIIFTYERSEYLRAFRRYRVKSLGSKRDLLLGTAAIAGGAFLGITGTVVVGAVVMITGLVLLAMVCFAIILQPILVYNAHPKLKDEYSLIFSDVGIAFHTDSIDSNIAWSLYSDWLQDDEFFMLFYGRRELLIVPKRALANGDENLLQSLLAEQVGSANSAGA